MSIGPRASALVGLWLAGAAAAHPGAEAHLAASDPQLAVHPCDLPLWTARARALGADGRVDEASGSVDRAVACGLDPLEEARLRGVLLAEADRPAEALPWLDRAVAGDPGHAGTLATRGRARAALGDLEGALSDEVAAAMASPTPQPDDLVRIAALYRELGRDDDALRSLEEGVARIGPSPALLEALVDEALRVGRPERALAALRAAPPGARVALLEGRTLAASGRLDEAREVLLAGLEVPLRPSAAGRALTAALQAELAALEAR